MSYIFLNNGTLKSVKEYISLSMGYLYAQREVKTNQTKSLLSDLNWPLKSQGVPIKLWIDIPFNTKVVNVRTSSKNDHRKAMLD